MIYLGIDVSKAKLDCTMLINAGQEKCKTKVVANSRAGVATLVQWCAKHGALAAQLHAVMEATGQYHEQPAVALYEQGMTVSIANPAQVRDFARALAMHSKNDALDSLVLARFGEALKPAPWEPPPVHVRELRALLARREALAKDLQRELNRQEKAETSETPVLIEKSIADAVAFLKSELKRLDKAINDHIDGHPDLKEDRDLLISIPAVGPQVGNTMLALMHTYRFESAEQLAAYLGLVSVQRQSGTSLLGRARLSKAGPARMRALLYMASIVAKRCNPHVKALYDRLVANGKAKMLALGAAMRKLVHLCFGVLKTRHPYSENYALPA